MYATNGIITGVNGATIFIVTINSSGLATFIAITRSSGTFTAIITIYFSVDTSFRWKTSIISTSVLIIAIHIPFIRTTPGRITTISTALIMIITVYICKHTSFFTITNVSSTAIFIIAYNRWVDTSS
jgi:hypothetical protein